MKQLAASAIVRYIFIGGLSYLIEICLIYGLVRAGVNELISVAVSFWVGFIIAFVLQKLFAFNNNDKTPKTLARQSLLYSALVIVNYAFTLSFVGIFHPLLGVFVARTIALLITTIWNYLLYSKIIFKVTKS